jgi:formylglycine-generating enzyme required for sulfatase activity
MKIVIVSVLAAVLILTFSRPLDAFLPGDPLWMSMDVVVNPMEGPPLVSCEASEVVEAYSAREWWISMTGVASGSHEETPPPGSPVTCGIGPFEWPGTDATAQVKVLYLVSTGSTKVRVIRQMEDERAVSVEVTADVSLLPRPDSDQITENLKLEIDRKFSITENREVFIPLLVADAEQQKTLGVREVYLRITLSEQLDEADTVYGVIWLTSDLKDADVLLDGGFAGALSTSGELFLRNVRSGLHEVGVRDSQGVHVNKVVRVEANRTVLAALSPQNETKDTAPFHLEPLGENEHGFPEYRRTIDGAVVVKIPEGEFLMGNAETERSPLEHDVYLSTYLMDKTGVTWRQYRIFAEATGIPLPPHEPYWGIQDDRPAVFVTWAEANNYCEWAGGRLPTEAEREKAARGTDGRMYPWGSEEPTPELAVFRRSWGYDAPGFVGQHPSGASPYGLLDMGGNVWEWCSDWYDDGYYAISPHRDPSGPVSGNKHVVRGGSWDSRPAVLSSSCRSWGHEGYRDGDFGFRCAMNSPE